ncbi:hypothetical protein GE09DRAFT_302768 [Coniochaeta sp. 2T2.1]|nr:hypothetical protein GE09DRAFT_302768 [Coniochaeta sp. 2T2.1]
MPDRRQSELNYELEDRVAQLLTIDPAQRRLSSLLVSAPLSELAGILKRHDFISPGEINDGAKSDSTDTSDSDDAVPNNLRETLNAELIPSSRPRTRQISQIANSLDMLDCTMANTSVQSRISREATGLRSGSTMSLPVRTREPQHTLGVGSPNRETDSTVPGSPSPFQNHPLHPFTSKLAIDSLLSQSALRRSLPTSIEVDRLLPAAELRSKKIGFLGELFIYKFFERQIGTDNWTYANWTSKSRFEAGHPPFTEMERDFSDFTYADTSGSMKELLGQLDAETMAIWSRNTTYHLEVKTTPGACNEAFFVSQNQVGMMRDYDSQPNNAYILIRVYNIDGEHPGIKFYANPWKLRGNGTLLFKADNRYKVFSRVDLRQ